MDESTSAEVTESHRKVLAHHWSKQINKIGYIEAGKHGFTLFISSLPKGGTVQFQERPFQPMISPIVELRAGEHSTSCAGCCQRVPFLSHPIQNTEVCQATGEKVGRKWLQEQKPGLSESIKGMQTLLTAFQSLLESPSKNHGGCLPC